MILTFLRTQFLKNCENLKQNQKYKTKKFLFFLIIYAIVFCLILNLPRY